MSKSGASELFSTLKSYINQLSDGERTPAEVASALNEWARESAESIKVRVHEEVEAAVLKMGFIKRDEFDALAARLAALEDTLAQSKTTPTKRKLSLGKLASSKLTAGKSVKKSTADKDGKR
jgi:BMFP domain-containing protein YqiC